MSSALVNVDTLALEIRPRLRNLLHQALVLAGYIVEGEDTPTQLKQQVRAKGNEAPKGELPGSSVFFHAINQPTYHRNDLLLHLGTQWDGNQL